MALPDDGSSLLHITELIQLQDVGILLEHVTWCRVTMTSDHWICIRHCQKGCKMKCKKCLVTILNPYCSNLPLLQWHIKADSAKMNPEKPIIALKSGSRFEIFNLESQLLLQKYIIDEHVCYWTWISSDVIGIVTDCAVFHWRFFKEGSVPEVMFKRHNRLSYCEIVSYKADANFRWFAITGLLPEGDHIQGITQLYSTDYNITQCIEAHTVCFTQYHFVENKHPSTILCAAVRHESQPHGKVHVVELGPYIPGNLALTYHYDHITFKEDSEKYDFPIALQVSVHYGLIYVVTKYGQLYMCDIESAACLLNAQVSPDVLFTSAFDQSNQGLIGVNRTGQVLSIGLKFSHLVPYIRDIAKKLRESERLSTILMTEGHYMPETGSGSLIDI